MGRIHLDYCYIVNHLAGNLNITIRSEGHDDPGRSVLRGLGIIRVNGKDYSPHGRGFNVVIANADTGIIVVLHGVLFIAVIFNVILNPKVLKSRDYD